MGDNCDSNINRRRFISSHRWNNVNNSWTINMNIISGVQVDLTYEVDIKDGKPSINDCGFYYMSLNGIDN